MHFWTTLILSTLSKNVVEEPDRIILRCRNTPVLYIHYKNIWKLTDRVKLCASTWRLPDTDGFPWVSLQHPVFLKPITHSRIYALHLWWPRWMILQTNLFLFQCKRTEASGISHDASRVGMKQQKGFLHQESCQKTVSGRLSHFPCELRFSVTLRVWVNLLPAQRQLSSGVFYRPTPSMSLWYLLLTQISRI